VYRTIVGNLDELYHANKPLAKKYGFILLLGIHWGQFREDWPVKKIEVKGERQLLNATEYIVRGLSGLTCVIPAQRILDLLNIPQLIEKRSKGDDRLERYYQEHGYPPEPETATEPIPDSDNPQHKEDFNSLVTAAAKKKPQDD
jgi:hypothetical protein